MNAGRCEGAGHKLRNSSESHDGEGSLVAIIVVGVVRRNSSEWGFSFVVTEHIECGCA